MKLSYVSVFLLIFCTFGLGSQLQKQYTGGTPYQRQEEPKGIQNSIPILSTIKILPYQRAKGFFESLQIRGGKEESDSDEDFRVETKTKGAEDSLEEKVRSTLMAWVQFWVNLYKSAVQSMLGNVTGTSESALQRFEREHGSFHPNFYAGTFSQATDFSRRKGRFTVVLIRPDGAKGKAKKQDDRICSALTDKKVISFIHRNFIFWSTTQSSKQAAKLASVLGGKKYPLLAIVHTSASSNKRKVVASHHLNPAPLGPQMLNWLNQTLILNKGLLLEDKRNQQKINAEIKLMREQRQAYEASIRADMQNELEEKRREKEEVARKAAEEERLRQLEEEKKQIAARREAKREALGPEPTPFIGEGKSVITVQFRFPDGRRETRRFLGTNTIAQVFDWADTLEVDIESTNLVSSFPKRVFNSREDQELTLSELGKAKSLSFFVEQAKNPEKADVTIDGGDLAPSHVGQ